MSAAIKATYSKEEVQKRGESLPIPVFNTCEHVAIDFSDAKPGESRTLEFALEDGDRIEAVLKLLGDGHGSLDIQYFGDKATKALGFKEGASKQMKGMDFYSFGFQNEGAEDGAFSRLREAERIRVDMTDLPHDEMRTLALALPGGDHITLCHIPFGKGVGGCVDIKHYGNAKTEMSGHKPTETQKIEDMSLYCVDYRKGE